MSIKVPEVQQRVLRALLNNGEMNAEELNVRMTTLQSMKSKGLIQNLQRFGTKETFGKERWTIYWKLTFNGKVFAVWE